MGEQIAGYELQEGKSITDLESWPPFVEWFNNQYGWEPRPRDTHDKEIFEAFLAGAYWESERGRLPFVTEGLKRLSNEDLVREYLKLGDRDDELHVNEMMNRLWPEWDEAVL